MYQILFLYLCKQFCKAIAVILAIIVIALLTGNYIDLLNSSVGKHISFGIITKIVFLKIPDLLHETVPFLMFISAILAFTKISKSNEYTVIKASGISIWQFLFPFLAITFIFGVLFITVLNPISTSLTDYNRKIINKYYSGDAASMLSFSGSGLWFIDKFESPEQQKRVVNAKYLNAKESQLVDVSFLILDKDYNFLERIDAKTATLSNGEWLLGDSTIFQVHKLTKKEALIKLPTFFKEYDLKNSFVSPDTISIWRLWHFISILKASGYSALEHMAYFYKILARPFLMCGLILIAASFALKPTRFVSPLRIIFYGLSSGFILFFFNEVITLLGVNGSVPSYLAAILSTLIVISLGVILILHAKE
jgi:lipopolysaccharide export system permease protein